LLIIFGTEIDNFQSYVQKKENLTVIWVSFRGSNKRVPLF